MIKLPTFSSNLSGKCARRTRCVRCGMWCLFFQSALSLVLGVGWETADLPEDLYTCQSSTEQLLKCPSTRRNCNGLCRWKVRVQSATCSLAAVWLLDASDKVSLLSSRSIIVRRRSTAVGSERTRVDLSVNRRSRSSSPTDDGTAATPSLPASDSVVSSFSSRISSGTSRIKFLSTDNTCM